MRKETKEVGSKVKIPRFIKTQPWQRDLAHRLWVEEQTTIDFILRTCRIGDRTFKHWRVSHKWDEQREQHSTGFADVVGALRRTLSQLAIKMEKLGDPSADGKAGDGIEKIGLAGKTMHQVVTTLEQVRRVQAEHGPSAQALKMSEDLLHFIKARSPSAFETLRPLLRQYVQERVFGRATSA